MLIVVIIIYYMNLENNEKFHADFAIFSFAKHNKTIT